MAALAYVPLPPPAVAAARGAAPDAAATTTGPTAARHPPRRMTPAVAAPPATASPAAAVAAAAAAAARRAAAVAAVTAVVVVGGVVGGSPSPLSPLAAMAAAPAAGPLSYGAKVLPATLSPAPQGVPSLPYVDFLDAVARGEVVRVDFYDAGNVALAVVAGAPAPVRLGEGYPIDVDDGWSSPLWCMRVLADRGVPYTLHWRR
ncbi:hypothetical protein MMPV_007849 [Pyropia vietnamensis]